MIHMTDFETSLALCFVSGPEACCETSLILSELIN